jgi:hypothetical protein
MKIGTNYDGKDKNYKKTAFWPSLHTLFNFAKLYHETAGLARESLKNYWGEARIAQINRKLPARSLFPARR